MDHSSLALPTGSALSPAPSSQNPTREAAATQDSAQQKREPAIKSLQSRKSDSENNGLAGAYFSLRGMLELAACSCVLIALLKLAGWLTLPWIALFLVGPLAVILFAFLVVIGLTIEVLGKDWIAGRK